MEKGYEKLEIYQLARELGVKVHKMTLSLPKFEMYEEGSEFAVHQSPFLQILLKGIV